MHAHTTVENLTQLAVIGGYREQGGSWSSRRRGRRRHEFVAVLRRLPSLQQEEPAGLPMQRHFAARVPPGVQEVRQVHAHRRRRWHPDAGHLRRPRPRPHLPVRGRAHKLLRAPLHAGAGCGIPG